MRVLRSTAHFLISNREIFQSELHQSANFIFGLKVSKVFISVRPCSWQKFQTEIIRNKAQFYQWIDISVYFYTLSWAYSISRTIDLKHNSDHNSMYKPKTLNHISYFISPDDWGQWLLTRKWSSNVHTLLQISFHTLHIWVLRANVLSIRLNQIPLLLWVSNRIFIGKNDDDKISTKFGNEDVFVNHQSGIFEYKLFLLKYFLLHFFKRAFWIQLLSFDLTLVAVISNKCIWIDKHLMKKVHEKH